MSKRKNEEMPIFANWRACSKQEGATLKGDEGRRVKVGNRNAIIHIQSSSNILTGLQYQVALDFATDSKEAADASAASEAIVAKIFQDFSK